MRLAAEISGEPTLLQLYHEGADLHVVTASKVFGVPLNEVTAEQRKTDKIINFGALYGGGVHYLIEELPRTIDRGCPKVPGCVQVRLPWPADLLGSMQEQVSSYNG